MKSFAPGKLFFAPMEGITDDTYRNVIEDLFPEWDFLASDFLRVPSAGRYPKKHILKHFGNKTYQSSLKNKTLFQILASPKSHLKEILEDINELNIDWLDLNLGCPSKTVVKNGGGSYLLSEPAELKKMVRTIRHNFRKTFTVKIRVGFRDDQLFEDNLKLLQDEGVEAITIHGRTREQLYKGRANWNYLEKAVKTVDIPIIGNGDIWSIDDIEKCFEQTGCHSLMIARGALKTPWLATNFYHRSEDNKTLRNKKIANYFESLHLAYANKGLNSTTIHKKFKALSRYPFEDTPELKSQVLRSQSLEQFFELITHS